MTMALREPDRSRLRQALSAAIGPQEAHTLVDQFPETDPPTPVTVDVLERRLGETERRLVGEVHGVEVRLTGAIHVVHLDGRDRTDALRTEMHTGFADLRTEMHTGFADARTELHERTDALQQRTDAFQAELRATGSALGSRLDRLEDRMATMPDVVTRQLLQWLIPLLGVALAVMAAVASNAGGS